MSIVAVLVMTVVVAMVVGGRDGGIVKRPGLRENIFQS